MRIGRTKYLLLLLSIIFCLVFSTHNLFAEDKSTENQAASTTANVEQMMAGLSDEQVRQMLIEELQKDASAQSSSLAMNNEESQPGPARFFGNLLSSLEDASQGSEDRYSRLFNAIPEVVPGIVKTFLQLCPIGTGHGALINFLWILLFIAIGIIAEFLFLKWIIKRHFNVQITVSESPTFMDKLGAGFINQLPGIMGVFVFVFAAYVANNLLLGTTLPFIQLVFLSFLIFAVWVRVTYLTSQVIFAPKTAVLRLVPLGDETAKTIHRMFVAVSAYLVGTIMFAIVIMRLSGEKKTAVLVMFIAATLLLIFTAIAILANKKRVTESILKATPEGEEVSWGRKRFASIWHFLGILYLLILWFLLVNNLGDPSHNNGAVFILSFFAVPIWLILDKVGQWVVNHGLSILFLSDDAIPEEELTEDDLNKKAREEKNKQRIHTFVRFSIMLAVGTWIATLWNIELPVLAFISNVLVDAIIVCALALLFWKFISDWIQRKIDEDTPEEKDKEEDDEWGGAANRGRSYTLLPMLRKFVGTVLFVMVVMTLLSEMGVNIGPLLAGAGVVGLAVGFGAQKLVADVFSGFFYLLDDAFRVGEYLEAGNVTGTVENISLRNIFLRHHRGMLQIVPHSELGAITNYMRGGMVVKFNLDFPYDADIDKIRKIIKKVGIAMLEDPVIGDGFIQPVKSQGVREITNSVMTIRVKFTAHPGKHFLIRREAYKRITEALNGKGIYYAHRKVIVDLPDLPKNLTQEEQQQVLKTAGAAAQQTIQAEEEAKAQQGGSKKDDGTF